MIKPRLLFAASEVYPFAKSGGLADVAHSLPRALSSDWDVHVVMPLYQFVERERFDIVALGETFDVIMGGVKYAVELYGCRYEEVEYRFIYSPQLCDCEFLYGLPESGYEDNAVRFGIFNYAILSLLKRDDYAVVHLNDWQSALAALLVKEDESIETKTLFTIHNLAYQGTFASDTGKALGIDAKYFTMEGVEFYGQFSFMKAGIAYADQVTTVSPTYAKEILTPEFGCGLDGFLQLHRSKLSGIVNGIDTEHFSPSEDSALVAPYSELSGKSVNKKAYLKEVGLKGAAKPLYVFIGRFTWQKGMELLIESLPKIVEQECNIAILGEGEAKYHDQLREIAAQHSNLHLAFGYDESLSHRMYAAADFLLMPSLFEPCGLNQMIAMHYGGVPVVHKVGGLADTVHTEKAYEPKSGKGYGVVFTRPTAQAFVNAVRNAQSLYEKRGDYSKIAKHNMACDFSWRESARSYSELYRKRL